MSYGSQLNVKLALFFSDVPKEMGLSEGVVLVWVYSFGILRDHIFIDGLYCCMMYDPKRPWINKLK